MNKFNVSNADEVTISDYGFNLCQNLNDIEIENIISIGSFAFNKCQFTSLTITSYDKDVILGNGCFSECQKLESFTMKSESLILENSVFLNCHILKNLTLFTQVKANIGDSCFENTALESVKIRGNVKEIGKYAFGNCKSLVRFYLEDSSKETVLNDYAFCNCMKLSNFTIVDGEIEVGKYTFCNCAELKEFTVKKVSSFDEYSFCNCTSLIEVITEGVDKISSHSFENCVSLTNFSFVLKAKEIGSYSFNGCKIKNLSLTEDKKLTIEEYSFYNCSELEFVSIVAEEASIGTFAFSNCPNLTTFYCCSDIESPPEFLFTNSPNLKEVFVGDDYDYDKLGEVDVKVSDVCYSDSDAQHDRKVRIAWISSISVLLFILVVGGVAIAIWWAKCKSPNVDTMGDNEYALTTNNESAQPEL